MSTSSSYQPINEDINNQHKTCRICISNEDKNDLIQPCECIGSVQFVHRSCLDKWRTMSHHAYIRCEICLYQYELEIVQQTPEEIQDKECRYCCNMTLDIFLFLSLIESICIIFGIITQACDHGTKIPSAFHMNPLFAYILFGHMLFFFFFGMFFSIQACCSSTRSTSSSGDTYFFYSSDHSNSDNSSCLAILVLCCVFIGIIGCITKCVECIDNLHTHHSAKLWRKQLVKTERVVDRSNNNRLTSPLNSSLYDTV